nr:(2Fe-2S)-binding protein [uncultured Draconibacterium sp.]
MYAVEAEPDTPLLWVIRDKVGLKGTKFGCGAAHCGVCTVLFNGFPIKSCTIAVATVTPDVKITTIESEDYKHLKTVQKAWTEVQVPQCGYCQSGQILTAVSLLNQNPTPSDAEIDTAMTAVLCRCGTYPRIKKAIKNAGEELKS